MYDTEYMARLAKTKEKRVEAGRQALQYMLMTIAAAGGLIAFVRDETPVLLVVMLSAVFVAVCILWTYNLHRECKYLEDEILLTSESYR